jgi:hypothetical protein
MLFDTDVDSSRVRVDQRQAFVKASKH